jgi:thymidylate synthase (FAD)
MTTRVRLVAITKPVIDDNPEIETAEQFIAYAARVSNPANQHNTKTASKLVKYLLEENHFSPLEMASMTLEICSTRDIVRQILRHRSFSFQEFSQRYAVADSFDYREARLQDLKNRQNSIELTEDKLELEQEWWNIQYDILEKVKKGYKWALDNGIAKEQARAVLPEGMTMSRVYMAGTIRSWVHYCQLRMANGTQKEHQIIAQDCWKIIEKQFPSIVEALDN